MADRNDIISLPHLSLREKSRKVKIIDQSVLDLVKRMEEATIDWEMHRDHEVGVALAAVQIDSLERVVVVRNNFNDKDDKSFTVLINPEIVKYEGELISDYEGCLSVKDAYGLVPRYSRVRVRALNTEGKQIRIKADGFLARVMQHEIDHTNGIVFVDRILNEPGTFYRLDKDGKLKKLEGKDYDAARISW